MNRISNNINQNTTTKAIATLIILITILLSNTINIHAQEQQTSLNNTSTNTIQKHSIKESIMYCIDSQLLKLSDISEEDKQSLNITDNNNDTNSTNTIYLSTLQDENGDQYNIYSDDNIINQWFVCIVDTLNTKDTEDDIIIDTYLLDEYVFEAE
jgi:hypothetical protein